MDSVELLTSFGLTRLEASIYLMLLTSGELTGYEAAKLTGVSRSNTYTALAGLCDKGAAYVVESAPTKYTPVTPEEFCNNVLHSLRKSKEELLKCIPQPHEEAEEYITIKGERHILDKMRNMLREAKERVYISVCHDTLAAVMPELKQIVERKRKLVIIASPPFTMEGAVVYHSEKSKNQIGLIVDSACVLTGDIADGDQSTCLYSKKKNLVELFKDSMRNEIKLIEITKGEQQ